MFEHILMGLLVVQALFLLAALVYIITSLHFEDRIVGTNLVGTIIINLIAMLAVYMGEGYGADIALVYAFLSFLAVVVLCRLLAVQNVERNLLREEKKEEKRKAAEAEKKKNAKRGGASA